MTQETRQTRDSIVQAAADLLAKGGRQAVTTRSVAMAAGVQVPTIYRQFGDMHTLLDAVVSYELDLFLQNKGNFEQHDDPIEALRAGWNCNISFGLSYPAFYTLMYNDPHPDAPFTATTQTVAFLGGLVQRIAQAGRLRIDVAHATHMIHAACCGVILTLLNVRPQERDLTLSIMTREALLDALITPMDPSMISADILTTQAYQNQVCTRAVALKAVLPGITTLTHGEQSLLSEWLDKLSLPSSCDVLRE